MVKDIIFCVKEIISYYVNKHNIPQSREECFINPACGCENPGKEIKCEGCSYLEGCLSHFQLGHKSMI
jgi:peptide deformylase